MKTLFTVALLSIFGEAAAQQIELRLLETTDIHMHIMNYDYYQAKETNAYGFARTATLIEKAREEAKNSVLVDNGDLIQGNPLGDYVVKGKHLRWGQVHPVYKAMNHLAYDVGNIGNHEFNYGLDFLNKALVGANFPYISANVYYDDHDKNPDNDQPYFEPYFIKTKSFVDTKGKVHQLKVGFIGFVPPQIMQWDKRHLEGKVVAKDIVVTARKYIPEMKKKGADLIIAIPHSGMGTADPKANKAANASYNLSKVPGIDAILYGHSHGVFPGKDVPDLPGVDGQKGTINGVPAVMPGFWGSHLGIIDLSLKKKNGKWEVVKSRSEARAIFKKKGRKTLPTVTSHPKVVASIRKDHRETVAWMNQKLGESKAHLHSYFSLVMDDPSVQLVNDAQIWYTKKIIKGTELEGLPVLSAAAPFKAGGRPGVDYYTDVPEGTISLRHVSDLYVYPNDLKVVKLTGAELIEWLERSAAMFKQIKPNAKSSLIHSDFRAYNFDVIDGIQYEIDVTVPSRYDAVGNLVNKKSKRIFNVLYNGKSIDLKQKFLVATNNYRATGGGKFPGLDGSNIVVDAPDKNRDIIAAYLMEKKTITPVADGNWSFRKGKPFRATFESSPKAKPLATDFPSISFQKNLSSGFSKYELSVK